MKWLFSEEPGDPGGTVLPSHLDFHPAQASFSVGSSVPWSRLIFTSPWASVPCPISFWFLGSIPEEPVLPVLLPTPKHAQVPQETE